MTIANKSQWVETPSPVNPVLPLADLNLADSEPVRREDDQMSLLEQFELNGSRCSLRSLGSMNGVMMSLEEDFKWLPWQRRLSYTL